MEEDRSRRASAEVVDPEFVTSQRRVTWEQSVIKPAHVTATFDFVMNGPLISEILFVPYDRWQAYAAERADLLEFIRTNPYGGQVLKDLTVDAE